MNSAEMLQRSGSLPARGNFPDLSAVITTGRDDMSAVRAERSTFHEVGVAQGGTNRFTSLCVPDTGSPVVATRQDELPIGTVRRPSDVPRVLQPEIHLACVCSPDPGATMFGHKKLLTVRPEFRIPRMCVSQTVS